MEVIMALVILAMALWITPVLLKILGVVILFWFIVLLGPLAWVVGGVAVLLVLFNLPSNPGGHCGGCGYA